ncbi:MAG: hypothetical protein JW982_15705 [Spirochaetes bacterium]|nr:hypothetical protein [Spirochaetota bacterium]
MFLNQCIASKTGLLNNRIIDFDKNITVVCGDNDSGKTLISRSIIDLLFSISSAKTILNPGVWDDFYLNCLFSIKTEQYKIIRNNATTQIYLSGRRDEKLIFDSAIDSEFPPNYELSRYMKSFDSYKFSILGYMRTPTDDYPEMNIFEETSGFFLNDSSQYLNTFNKLNDYFSISGINKNIENVLTKKILEHENEIRQIEKNLDLNKLKEQKKLKLNNEKINLINEKKIYAIKLESIERNLENLTTLGTLYDEHGECVKKIESLSEKINTEKTIKSSIETMKENIRKIFPKFADMDPIQKENFEVIQTAYRYIKNLDDEIIKTNDFIIHKKKFYKRTAFTAFFLSASASAAVLFQKYVKIERNILIAVIGTIGFLLAYVLIFSMIKICRYSKFKKAADLKNERDAKCSEFFEILKSNNLSTEDLTIEEIYELLLQYFEEFGFYTEHEEEIDVLNSSLQDKETFSKLKTELSSARTEQDKCSKKIKALIKDIGLYTDSDPLGYPISQAKAFFDEEAVEFRSELNKISDLIDQIDAELEHSASDITIDSGFETAMEDYRSRLKRLELYDKNIRYMISIFNTAIEKRKNRIISQISGNTALLFNEITSNQYNSTVTNQVIEEFIRTGKLNNLENKSLPNIIELSMKIAVTDYLEDAGLTIPLIIDEPGMYLDRNRIARLKNVLYDFSKKRQIVIFTHDINSFMKYGKRVNL